MYVLESLPQLDYPMPIGSLPAWPVNATCAMLTKVDATDPDALISAAAEVVHMLMGPGLSRVTKNVPSCIPTPDEGPGGIPGDGPGGISAWSFQSCTETHGFAKGATYSFKYIYIYTYTIYIYIRMYLFIYSFMFLFICLVICLCSFIYVYSFIHAFI